MGMHLLKCWRSTQPGIALSQGEAEFYCAAKGASTGVGMKALYRDIGYDLLLRLWTGSSAAVGICSRQDLGKLGHLESTSLWIQQRIRHGELEVRKIAGEKNPGDLYTKHLESKANNEQLVGLFGGEFRVGRAEAAPRLQKDPAVAGIIETLISEPEPSSGGMADIRVLPHFMPEDEANDLFPIFKLDEGESQWAIEFEQVITRPADELAGPGPRGKVDFVPAMSQAGAIMVTDDYFNNDSNTVIGVCVSGATATSDAAPDKACSAMRLTHVIDFYSDVISDYDYDAVNGTDGKFEVDSFSYLIGAYENDAVSEADDDSEQCRVDSCPRRARRWPLGHRDPGTRPARGACVCCPESLAIQCGGLWRPCTELRGDLPRGLGPGGSSPNRIEKAGRKNEYQNHGESKKEEQETVRPPYLSSGSGWVFSIGFFAVRSQ